MKKTDVKQSGLKRFFTSSQNYRMSLLILKISYGLEQNNTDLIKCCPVCVAQCCGSVYLINGSGSSPFFSLYGSESGSGSRLFDDAKIIFQKKIPVYFIFLLIMKEFL